MRVEGSNLVDLRLRHAQFVGERHQMGGREMTIFVLDEMQELDQKITPPLYRPQQRPDFVLRRRVDLAALRHRPRRAPT